MSIGGGGDAHSWHQNLVDEVARRAEVRAEELEQRFKERMETSLSFELAKIEHAKRRAASPQPAKQLARGWEQSIHHEPTSEESFRHLHQLRERYAQMQGHDNKAHWREDEVRVRLSDFYTRICPAKLLNVGRIVASFEGRGGSKLALHDLNGELMATYGYDLYSVREYEGIDHSPSRTATATVSAQRPALQERLAMLCGESRHVHLQHHSPVEEQNMVMYNIASATSRKPVATPLLGPTMQPHQTIPMLSSDLPSPQFQSKPFQLPFVDMHLQHLPQPKLQQKPHSPQLLHSPQHLQRSSQQQEQQNQTQSPKQQTLDSSDVVLLPRTSFIGMPSPRWAGIIHNGHDGMWYWYTCACMTVLLYRYTCACMMVHLYVTCRFTLR